MPLDEQTRAFIEKSSAKPAPPPGSMPLEDFRAAVEAFRPLGFEREDVASVHELAIPGEHGADIAVRLYVPDTGEPPPVVVWAHGGSWVRVTVDLLDGHFRVYANRSGCAIAAVDYRLSPEARFPTALEEVYGAARWIRRNAAELGCDPERIGIAGESSGGNLAAAATLLDQIHGHVGFAHQALLVPVLDTRFASPSWEELGRDYLLTKAQLEWALTQYAPGVQRTEPLLSPLCATNLEGLPPTLIVTGELDPLHDDGERYAAALREAGVSVEHVDHPGLIHHAIMVPGLIDLGRRVVEETATAIGRSLSGAGSSWSRGAEELPAIRSVGS
jgi:acetyl esterase/lipase